MATIIPELVSKGQQSLTTNILVSWTKMRTVMSRWARLRKRMGTARRPIRDSAHACRMKLCVSHFLRRPVDNCGRGARPSNGGTAICGKAAQLSAGKSERQLCTPSLASSSFSLPPFPLRSPLFTLISSLVDYALLCSATLFAAILLSFEPV